MMMVMAGGSTVRGRQNKMPAREGKSGQVDRWHGWDRMGWDRMVMLMAKRCVASSKRATPRIIVRLDNKEQFKSI